MDAAVVSINRGERCFSNGSIIALLPIRSMTDGACTILTLCSGVTLANTEYCIMLFCNTGCEILSNSSPVMAKSCPFKIPNSFAIALAVAIWSPVIITVFIPAFLQVLTASFTPSLGGSIIPISPYKN